MAQHLIKKPSDSGSEGFLHFTSGARSFPEVPVNQYQTLQWIRVQTEPPNKGKGLVVAMVQEVHSNAGRWSYFLFGLACPACFGLDL
jgi:hypothetical protein